MTPSRTIATLTRDCGKPRPLHKSTETTLKFIKIDPIFAQNER